MSWFSWKRDQREQELNSVRNDLKRLTDTQLIMYALMGLLVQVFDEEDPIVEEINDRLPK